MVICYADFLPRMEGKIKGCAQQGPASVESRDLGNTELRFSPTFLTFVVLPFHIESSSWFTRKFLLR